MELVDILRLNIFSPMVLAFGLGVVAVLVKSDLQIPPQVYSIISIYLLFGIGLKGGFDLARFPTTNFAGAALVAVGLGVAIMLSSVWLLRRLGRFDDANAIAIAIHYSGVSAVTLSASLTFLNETGATFEGFMPTMYVLMELPAVIVGLTLAAWRLGSTNQSPATVLKAALSGKSFLLLGGGVLIGLISGEAGYQQMKPFFIDLFPGFLTLFLLEMGTLVGKRLSDLPKTGLFLFGFGIIMPLLHGVLGVWLGTVVGLSVGGSMIMGTLAASASYITAPAVVETNLPTANVSYALTGSLVITFPFNLAIGLPIYFELAKLFAG